MAVIAEGNGLAVRRRLEIDDSAKINLAQKLRFFRLVRRMQFQSLVTISIIDHNKGTAYTYPTWIQLVFGKTLVFDRSDEKDGQPVQGRAPEPAK